MINLSAMNFRKPVLQGSYILPVAIMSQIYEATLFSSLIQLCTYLIQSAESHALHHLLFRHRKQLDGFYYIIAEKMIKLFFYFQNLFFGLFWKRAGYISMYDIPTVFQSVKQRYKQHVRYKIKYSQRQQREQIPEEKNQIVYKFH